MDFGFSQSINNLLLDNIDEDIPMLKSASTPVMNHQSFKEKINLVFEKYDEVKLSQLKKSVMKEFLSQYLPKSTCLENENNLIIALKNHVVSKMKFYFSKKKKKNGNKKPAHFYSDLNAVINAKTISLKRAKSLLSRVK